MVRDARDPATADGRVDTGVTCPPIVVIGVFIDEESGTGYASEPDRSGSRQTGNGSRSRLQADLDLLEQEITKARDRPRVLQVLSPLSAMALAAVTAAVRWTVLGQTSSVLALGFAEPLHGITFALLHLACMRILVMATPATLAGTAQTIYAFGIGVCSVALTFCSGLLYERVGRGSFLVMAVVAAAALPAAWLLARAIASTPFRGSRTGEPGSHTPHLV
jgi:hypothetical protein